jgi:hypothetical protein
VPAMTPAAITLPASSRRVVRRRLLRRPDCIASPW